MKKNITVEVKVKLNIDMDDDKKIEDVMNEMDYRFSYHNKQKVSITADRELVGYEVKDWWSCEKGYTSNFLG